MNIACLQNTYHLAVPTLDAEHSYVVMCFFFTVQQRLSDSAAIYLSAVFEIVANGTLLSVLFGIVLLAIE